MWQWFVETLRIYPEIAIFLSLGLGYFFGKAIPPEYVDLFFIALVVLMVAASTAPALVHLWRQRREKTAEGA